ncbi:MAG: 30S ribosomal protein S12 methylthiotransferase RimO [Vicinamibacteria bacterium]|nr:30S ribosomal protein S12 methylthiotransferase RimO [Vicinamibacteria bacterium]
MSRKPHGRCPSKAPDARPRVGLVSLGCPKNRVDSEAMLARLQARGCGIVSDTAQADVIIVNTCAFIEPAKRESIDAILEMARHKQYGGVRRMVVTGCLAQRYDAELRRAIPEIDSTLGTGQIEWIERAVLGMKTTVSGTPGWLPGGRYKRVLSTPPHLAYVKISEGCNYACSFCVIPKLRGRYRSRSIESIVTESRGLVAKGVLEIVLVAQDTTRYGLDLGMKHGLARLLRSLCGIKGLRWIRVLYAHPATLGNEVLDAIASEEKVVKYIDLPLQHASDHVLSMMRRPTGHARLNGLVERMRKRAPGLAIRTSFIVGFPGETERDFSILMRFVETARFDHVGVFTFSREEGTRADGIRAQTPEKTKERRRGELMRLQQSICLARNRRRVGERVDVLIETPGSPDGPARGRLSTQAPDIDGSVLIVGGDVVPGAFVRCEIIQAGPYDLVVKTVR